MEAGHIQVSCAVIQLRDFGTCPSMRPPVHVLFCAVGTTWQMLFIDRTTSSLSWWHQLDVKELKYWRWNIDSVNSGYFYCYVQKCLWNNGSNSDTCVRFSDPGFLTESNLLVIWWLYFIFSVNKLKFSIFLHPVYLACWLIKCVCVLCLLMIITTR